MLDHNKLKGDEIVELRNIIEEYKDYDKLDILIEMALNKIGISKEDFKNRIFD